MLYIEPTWSPRQRRNLSTMMWQAAWMAKGAHVFRGLKQEFQLVGTPRLEPVIAELSILSRTITVLDSDSLMESSPDLLKSARRIYDRPST